MTNELLWLTLSLWTYKLNNFLIKIELQITNILVDSVFLPNKPLSNLEIIDAAKKLSFYGFRGVFLRDILPKKQIK